ncbi:putative CRISPR-associated Cas4 nuclease [Saccharolobus solfataricus rod-shaped virus 1]|uniref:Putative CRISPR-associated Cas4 nuclease n=1 Tax=Saccharolobus solfataricus rod-shaped virus 1 TaxID=2730619 RepID=A0A6M3VYY2_SSRV1|nr:putative CRISPR-associated Cas4 nuclease [Saccharolobus solfataricus rod-shaped virus 1]QJF12285.1 putative CRISPR-associated Cas4 nuclease [Saccharolobus solfataricus rod-shaped virus 1]
MVYENKIKESFKKLYPENILYPSEIAYCLRKTILARRIQHIKNIGSEVADYGLAIHNDVEAYFKEKLGCETEKAIEYEIEGVKISARVDLLCGSDLLELKTVSHFIRQPYQNHIVQVSLYYHILSQLNYKIDNVYLVYINRQNYDVQEFKIQKDQLDQGLKSAIEFIRNYKKYKDEQNIFKIPIGDTTFCRSCEFRNICYGTITNFLK